MRRGEKRNVGRGTESDRIRMEEGEQTVRTAGSSEYVCLTFKRTIWSSSGMRGDEYNMQWSEYPSMIYVKFFHSDNSNNFFIVMS